MKRLVLTAVLVLFCLSGLQAQVEFGLKAGLNVASITGDETDNLSSLTSFHVGAVANIGISETFSVQPEILYSAQGAKYEDSEDGGIIYDGKFKLDYINIPVLAQLEVSEGLRIEAGPQLGFNISAKDEYESPGDSGEDDIDEFIKGTDFGAAVGLNYSLANGLNVGARYTFGLSDLWDFDTDLSNKNSVFMVSVGFMFGRGAN